MKNTRFDNLFEKYSMMLSEREYIDSTFEDNIRLLVKILRDNDYVSSERDLSDIIEDIMSQEKNVKVLTLDTNEEALPPIRLHLRQESDSESFSVTVINVNDPEKQKEFKNTMLETIFDEVVDYVKQTALQGLRSSNAVEQLPQEEGPMAQPGGGESELPAVGEEEIPSV